jgi:hypothetical protein
MVSDQNFGVGSGRERDTKEQGNEMAQGRLRFFNGYKLWRSVVELQDTKKPPRFLWAAGFGEPKFEAYMPFSTYVNVPSACFFQV